MVVCVYGGCTNTIREPAPEVDRQKRLSSHSAMEPVGGGGGGGGDNSEAEMNSL